MWRASDQLAISMMGEMNVLCSSSDMDCNKEVISSLKGSERGSRKGEKLSRDSDISEIFRLGTRSCVGVEFRGGGEVDLGIFALQP